MKNIRVTYDPFNGEPTPDGIAEDKAKNICTRAPVDGTPYEVKTSSGVFVDALRVLVCEGVIKGSEIVFLFQNYVLSVNDQGRLDYWPKGFGDTWENFLMRLIEWPAPTTNLKQNENPS